MALSRLNPIEPKIQAHQVNRGQKEELASLNDDDGSGDRVDGQTLSGLLKTGNGFEPDAFPDPTGQLGRLSVERTHLWRRLKRHNSFKSYLNDDAFNQHLPKSRTQEAERVLLNSSDVEGQTRCKLEHQDTLFKQRVTYLLAK